jgi:hypothetical protein
MRKIDIIKILMLILKQDRPEFNLKSGGLLFQAVLWHTEIQDMFRILGVAEQDITPYVEDYVNRIYLLKIKQVILYHWEVTISGNTFQYTFHFSSLLLSLE